MTVKRVVAASLLCICFLADGARADVGQKLKDGLSASSPKVRIVAVAGVAKTKDPQARLLIEPLLRDPDANVRATVVEGLGLIGDPAALPALESVSGEGDTMVSQALARVIAALRASRISIYVGKGEDKSNHGIAGLGDELAKQTKAAIDKKLGSIASIHDDASKKSFGASPIVIRSIEKHKDGPNTFLDVKCELTLVDMPQNILRAALASTASVGVQGDISAKLETELAHDAINACAPELADDFVSYVREHARR